MLPAQHIWFLICCGVLSAVCMFDAELMLILLANTNSNNNNTELFRSLCCCCIVYECVQQFNIKNVNTILTHNIAIKKLKVTKTKNMRIYTW